MSDPFDLDNLSEMQPSEQMAENNIPPFYLEGLNPPQLEAIRHIDGPILVLAGAGTGKTRVLTTRLAHILATGRAYPNQILAVTFTNKAAHEMKDRVGAIIGSAVENMFWLGTFHSICVKILRRHADLVGEHLGAEGGVLLQQRQDVSLRRVELHEGWPCAAVVWSVRARGRQSRIPGGADLLAQAALGQRRCSPASRSHKRIYSTFSSSTSNTRVALGGITPPAPRAP